MKGFIPFMPVVCIYLPVTASEAQSTAQSLARTLSPEDGGAGRTCQTILHLVLWSPNSRPWICWVPSQRMTVPILRSLHHQAP